MAMRLGTAAEQPGQAGAKKGKSRLEGAGRPHTSQQLGLSPAAVGDNSDETVRWDKAKAEGGGLGRVRWEPIPGPAMPW